MFSKEVNKLLGGVLVLAALGSEPALAQAVTLPSFELERLELDPSAKSSLVVGTGEILEPGQFRLSGVLHYQHNPLVIYESNRPVATVVGSRLGVHLTAAFGLLEWLEVGAQLPVVAYQSGGDLSQLGLARPASAGLGTPWVNLRAGLLRPSDALPVSLSISLATGLPVGSGAAFARDPDPVWVPEVAAGFHFDDYVLAAELGARIRRSVELTPGSGQVADEIGSTLSGGLVLVNKLRPVGFEVSLRGEVPFVRTAPNLELLGGVRWRALPVFELFALAGPGMVGGGGATSSPGTPTFRVLLGGALVPADRARECVAGEPHEPVDCPELDWDGDGIINRVDRCPLVPEDFNGIEDEDGCPEGETDRDGDGIVDRLDRCPDEPGIVELHGCPPKDTDGDTVYDHVDNCPTVPGPPENHGCPEQEKQQVQITRERLLIKDRVYFDFNKATIKARSFALLNQVAQVLNDHPNIDRVIIEGHTDNIGGAAYNRRLSMARARAVREYLENAGVDGSRLRHRGYGLERPIDTNDTEEGRANNRRVEFVIVQPGAPDPGDVDEPVDGP